jgi:hypothetical protein
MRELQQLDHLITIADLLRDPRQSTDLGEVRPTAIGLLEKANIMRTGHPDLAEIRQEITTTSYRTNPTVADHRISDATLFTTMLPMKGE